MGWGWLWLGLARAEGGVDALGPGEATVEALYLGWRWISLADGPKCPFRPSCSAFARQVVRRDGVLGLPLVFDRLVRDAAADSYPRSADGLHVDPVREHVRVVDLVRGCRAARRAGAGACPR